MDENLLKRAQYIQKKTLTAYPNPQRTGCPGGEQLKQTAQRTDYEHLFNEPVWEHITHCSPCYQEYSEFVRKRKKR